MSYRVDWYKAAYYAAMLALAFMTLPANASPYWKSIWTIPIVCTTPEDAVNVHNMLFRYVHNPEQQPEIQKLISTGRCRQIEHETKFLVAKKEHEYSQIRLLPLVENDPFIYIGQSVNGPFDDEAAAAAKLASANRYPPGCREPGGGEVDRMEVGPNGQMFLKRYFITEKCVNGQMRSFTKRLN